MVHFVLLVVCAVVIYLSCEWFVNAVEWLGARLRLGPLAVGTVLAAFGTALPESVVTLVAVLGSDKDHKDIGVGAALGGPLALSTVAYGITGFALVVLARRRTSRGAGTPNRDGTGTLRTQQSSSLTQRRGPIVSDQTWFLAIFAAKVGLGLVGFPGKSWLGLLFFAAYGLYFWRQIRTRGDGASDDLEPLRLTPRRARPSLLAIVLQTAITVIAIFVASQIFVGQLDAVGPMLHLKPAVTALLLAPIATELPEVMNAIIWVRQGKTALALANISGAMMIQATVPSGLGLLFTPWRLDSALIIAATVTAAAIGYLLILARTGRFRAGPVAASAGFYLVFAVGLALTT